MPSDALILIGYFPKKVVSRPDWHKAAQVKAIRSVSYCISEGPQGWMEHWTHNEMYVYSSIKGAQTVVSANERHAFEIHAYRLFPLLWDDGVEGPLIIPQLKVEAIPENFRSAGFDVVEINQPLGIAGFGCSPLSCNSMAEEIHTNSDCLLDDLETAKRVAVEFSKGDVEPGPYCVVEVLRAIG